MMPFFWQKISRAVQIIQKWLQCSYLDYFLSHSPFWFPSDDVWLWWCPQVSPGMPNPPEISWDLMMFPSENGRNGKVYTSFTENQTPNRSPNEKMMKLPIDSLKNLQYPFENPKTISISNTVLPGWKNWLSIRQGVARIQITCHPIALKSWKDRNHALSPASLDAS